MREARPADKPADGNAPLVIMPACSKRDDKTARGIEKFEIKCLKVRGASGAGEGGVENNGTEGARGPIETTIYQQPLLSIMAPDGNADRTRRKVVLSVS